MSQLARAWTFTHFPKDGDEDLSSDFIRRLQDTEPLVLVAGHEICPDTKRPHIQGYIRWKNVKRFSWWKNQFPTTHVEVRQGTEKQAIDYCLKEGTPIVDERPYSEAIKPQGEEPTNERAAFAMFARLVDEGHNWWEIRKTLPYLCWKHRTNCLKWMSDHKWKVDYPDYTDDPVL